jgi:hypothetical protein
MADNDGPGSEWSSKQASPYDDTKKDKQKEKDERVFKIEHVTSRIASTKAQKNGKIGVELNDHQYPVVSVSVKRVGNTENKVISIAGIFDGSVVNHDDNDGAGQDDDDERTLS